MIKDRLTPTVRTRELAASVPPHRLALAAILALSAFLELFRLGREGFGNLYYAATVKSMLASWHNFFFASYDPGGFVTVDKPPLGFWIQAASAKLFGFHGWSMLLPQVFACVLCVALLYLLVRRAFGPVAGLLAALALAVTPITVATARNNTTDVLLVLALLVAAWAVCRATETGRLRWLLLGMILVGLGFNIKMLQAYLVLPALYLVYLMAPIRWWKRLFHLALATAVLLVVSLSWTLAVDLTPPEERPYVGGSSDNTVLDLVIGYNGLNRLLGNIGSMQAAPVGQQPVMTPNDQQPQGVSDGQSSVSSVQQQSQPDGQTSTGAIAAVGGENGAPGPLRFFNPQLAGQISWLLPLAGLGLLVAGRQTLSQPSAGAGGAVYRVLAALRQGLSNGGTPDVTRRRQALMLWGVWLLTTLVFFSAAEFWHTYYLTIVAPPIAALVGAGAVALWQDYEHSRSYGWLLPIVLLGMAALQASILVDYPDWRRWLIPSIAGLCAVATGGLVVARLWPRFGSTSYPRILATVGVLALFVAPATWSIWTAWDAPGEMLPRAKPEPDPGSAGAPANAAPFGPNAGGSGVTKVHGPDEEADPELVEYLLENRGESRYLVATQSSASASPIILSTGEPVMALGGFGGGDQILTADELSDLVSSGEVRFFLVMDMDEPTGGNTSGNVLALPANGQQPSDATGAAPSGVAGPPTNDLMDWVRNNCEPVPPEQWRAADAEGEDPGEAAGDMGEKLYDCGGEGR